MIKIVEVNSKKEIKNFLNFPLKLYKGNKSYVPPLYADEKKMFRSDYMYYDQSESKFWNAYKDGVMVGRVQAILQKAANKKWNQKRVRFTRFDSIDDQEVADALLKAVEDFAKEKGMTEVVGPLGFSDLEREGLLIEGFEYLNTFEEQFNYPYYQKLIENYGFKKDVDWIENRVLPDHEKAEKIYRVSQKLLEKSGFKFVVNMPYKKFAKHYKDQFFGMLDESYDKLYGTVPFTEGMKNLVMNNFTPLINSKYLMAVVDENDKFVAFCIAFPSIGEELQKSGGHLYPLTALRLLWRVKHPKRIDLGLIGVDPQRALTGATAIIVGYIAHQMEVDKLEYMESNLNLEDNLDIINVFKHFNIKQHKRRRSFVKKIK